MLDKLWRHVQRRAQHEIEPFFLVEFLSKAQISNLDVKTILIFFYQQNVLGLQVSVRD